MKTAVATAAPDPGRRHWTDLAYGDPPTERPELKATKGQTAAEAMAEVDWSKVDWSGHKKPAGQPFATHVGTLEGRGRSWRVFRLSDGREVFDRNDRSEWSTPPHLSPGA